MVRDEAPAATIGGFNEREFDRAEISSTGIADLDSRDGPTSLVAAEIHLGRPAGICGGWLHCNIQVACHPASRNKSMKYQYVVGFSRSRIGAAAANFGQPA
jgi:hypothetical protein